MLASSLSTKISQTNQTSNILDISKFKCNTTNDNYQGYNNDDTETNSIKNSPLQQEIEASVKEIIEASKNSPMKNGDQDNREYNGNALPLIIGDTVHILEENGEGKTGIQPFLQITQLSS